MKSILLSLAVIAGPASGSNSTQHDDAAYHLLVQQDLRLATIGYRLASANAPLCKKQHSNLGWVLHDEAQYPNSNTAREALIFREPVAVAAVVSGGPADQLGVKAGDGLVGLNGRFWDWGKTDGKSNNSQRMEMVHKELAETLATEGTIEIILNTDDGQKSFLFNPSPVCASRFWVDTRSKLDAGADGHNVRVTEGLMAFVKSDDELAAAVAHELSHNILNHRQRLDLTGRGAGKILETEIEADRLSIWLLANAAFDPSAALTFAERFGRRTGLGIFSEGTHLRWRNRVKVMQAEIAAMQSSDKTDGVLRPLFLDVAVD